MAIFTANGDADTILSAAGLYLFAFTYLYVGLNLTFGLDPTGLGYFCLFVFVSALVYSGLNFFHFGDPGFGVIWLYWAFLWLLFFLVLGRGVDSLSRYTGAVCAIQGWVTAWIPAFLLLTGTYAAYRNQLAVALAIFGVVVFGGLYVTLGRRGTPVPSEPTPSDHSRPESNLRATPRHTAFNTTRHRGLQHRTHRVRLLDRGGPMLSRDEARAWAEIERRLVREDAARSRLLRRCSSSVTAQTVVPLVLATLFTLLDAQVPALFCLFTVPLGLVFHMARTPPPHAVGRSNAP